MATVQDASVETPTGATAAEQDSVRLEQEAKSHGGPGPVAAGTRENKVAADAKPDESLNLEAAGRKVIALDKQAHGREIAQAKADAGIVEIIAGLIPISKKLKLKVVAGWIREARKGAHNFASSTTYLQDPSKATAPDRVKVGSDSYRQLAYRRMNIARITAACQGRLTPGGKSLWRKSETPENVSGGVEINLGDKVVTYKTPVDMLMDGYSLRKTLQIWTDAIRPKVVNLRARAERPTVEVVQGVVETLTAPAKVQETTKDGEIIEKTRNIKVMTDAELCGMAVVEMLKKSVEFQYGPTFKDAGHLDEMLTQIALLQAQEAPKATDAPAQA